MTGEYFDGGVFCISLTQAKKNMQRSFNDRPSSRVSAFAKFQFTSDFQEKKIEVHLRIAKHQISIKMILDRNFKWLLDLKAIINAFSTTE